MINDVARFLASHPFSAATKETYRRVLILLIQLPELAMVGAEELLKFVDRPGWGNSQQYVALCACRRFLGWLYGAGNPALTARIKRVRPRRQRVLSVKMALELLASFDPYTAKGARDLAIAALALDTGLRCSEICRLALADMDLDQRNLQVIIKGGQWGTAIYSPETAQYIREWLAFRKARPGVGTVFVSTFHGRPLTREGLQTIVKKWGVRLGMKLSPHDLRRSFATLATIFGAPSRVVQVAGRWEDIQMVEYYTQSLDPAAITPFLPVTRLQK
jgi:integrase/recombinase XerD